MELRKMKVSINGPLVHWGKILILKNTMKLMHKANVIARNAAHECTINDDTKGIDMAESIIKSNATNLIKASELIDVATLYLPNEWKSWPELN